MMQFLVNTLFSNKKLVAILVASFFFSILYSFYYKINPVVDARAYDQIAEHLVAGCGFRENCATDFVHDPAITRAGPAYEFFLAGIFFVFGHSYAAVWVLQALMHAATAGIVFKVAGQIFSNPKNATSLWAAALIGFHPDLIEISAMLMTETLYLFLLSIVLWFFVRLYQEPSRYLWALLAGLSVAFATLSRPPVALFVPVILFLYAAKKYFRQGAVFVVVFAAALAPWTIRNYQIFHTIIPTTLIGEYNLWVGNTTESSGGQLSSGYNPVTAFGSQFGYAGLSAEVKKQTVNFIVAHPQQFIRLCLIRIVRYFSLIRPMGFWFYETGWPQAVFVFTSGLSIAVLFITGLAGILKTLKENKALYIYIVVLALVSPLVLIPTVVESRYRFQVYPFLAIFGAYWIQGFLQAKKIDKAFWFAAAFLVAITAVDAATSLPEILSHLKVILT